MEDELKIRTPKKNDPLWAELRHCGAHYDSAGGVTTIDIVKSEGLPASLHGRKTIDGKVIHLSLPLAYQFAK